MVFLLIAVFVLGYLAIALESRLGLDKAGTALLTGVLLWGILFVSRGPVQEAGHLLHDLANTAQIIFFLMGAMAIVELVDMHNGFAAVTRLIATTSRVKFLLLLSGVSFLLSAVLDNLTTAIVMTSVARKMVPDKKDLAVYAALVVIAANAGGAWSPIGDVTTTMLWIGGRISSTHLVAMVLLPSLVSIFIPIVVEVFRMRRGADLILPVEGDVTRSSRTSLFVGTALLLSVPVVKTLTGLPPFMAMLLGLGIFWVYSEIVRRREKTEIHGHVAQALQRMDLAGLLFFIGILLAVGALGSAGILSASAEFLTARIPDHRIVTFLIGVVSAVVDNVPLVAAAMDMYSLSAYPVNHDFWILLAYAAGTGGSLLIIGSAAGVVAMGIGGIEFMWYLKRMTLPVLAGYALGFGVLVLLLQTQL